MDMDNNQTHNIIYYGVHIPNNDTIQVDNGGSELVFVDKSEALKEVKKYKKARFKAFDFYHAALEFSHHGCDFESNSNNNSFVSSTSTPNELLTYNKSNPESTTTGVGEKPSQFRGPKSQDLVKFRKAIENGDVQYVKEIIWENPRYLISSGDTPAILQEGARYNALHIAAKAKNVEMCQLILSTISNTKFLKLLYGEENEINAVEASKILVDLYLNTPDKGVNETPLHFAVKYGAADVVECLVSYPSCDRNVMNKYSLKPKDMICNRDKDSNPKLIEKISGYLQEQFYVPVLRSEDNCFQPMIGELFSPTSPPNLNSNRIEPRLEIHAYAGPMKKDEACVFRKTWKTPPRTHLFANHSFCKSADFETEIRLQDNEKGLERVGRDLAKKFQVPWKEYWPFLDTFTDLTAPEGLQHLDNYFKIRFVRAANAKLSEEIYNIFNNMASLSINDNEYNVDVFFIEKSYQVLSNRISAYIASIYNTADSINNDTDRIFETLALEIKHLKTLTNSFIQDPKFGNCINFQSVHSRIAILIANKLKHTVNLSETVKILELVLHKSIDEFSSDDEDHTASSFSFKRKLTSDRKQVICLLEHILKSIENDQNLDQIVVTEENCIDLWKNASPCDCIWKTINTKKNANSFKIKNTLHKYYAKRNLTYISRRLTFLDDELVVGQQEKETDSSSSDEYHSADNSDVEESETFQDAPLDDSNVYIEGTTPTKMDFAVFTVIKDLNIKNEDYPYVYRWRHSMKMFPEEEKHRWPSPYKGRLNIPTVVATTPKNSAKKPVHTFSPQPWMRVTGQNSPIRTLYKDF